MTPRLRTSDESDFPRHHQVCLPALLIVPAQCLLRFVTITLTRIYMQQHKMALMKSLLWTEVGRVHLNWRSVRTL